MADPDSTSSGVFDVDQILRLIALMKEHDLTEINLRQSDQKIQLKRGGPPPVVGYSAAPMAPAAQGTPMPAAEAIPAPPSEEAAPPDDENVVVVTSPMVGTYYTRANPEADAFVEVGDRVDPETTVCIIEAMKVFNEINLDMCGQHVSGELVAILVENEEPVEFGKPLFKVDISK